MPRSRKWTRRVVEMVRESGMEVRSIQSHAAGHLCIQVAWRSQEEWITASSIDGDPRLWLNTRAQIRRVARALRQRHEQHN